MLLADPLTAAADRDAFQSLFSQCERPAELSSSFVRSIINARMKRRQFFDERLFADPAWDMLLELYALECEGRSISISKLSFAAGVPGTTALRWVDKLEEKALIVRTDDALDGRRTWIALSERGFATMRLYLEQITGLDSAV